MRQVSSQHTTLEVRWQPSMLAPMPAHETCEWGRSRAGGGAYLDHCAGQAGVAGLEEQQPAAAPGCALLLQYAHHRAPPP